MATPARIITDQVIAALERGTVPWRKPWKGGAAGAPRNLASGKPYRGVNVVLLAWRGFASPYWATFKQIAAAGGVVRRGEKATKIVFYKRVTKDKGGDEERTFSMLRYYHVFNLDQTEGVDAPDAPIAPEPIARCEEIVAGMPNPPTVREGQRSAFYRPLDDVVGMPPAGAFESNEKRYSTLFHELGHSTGHPSRLDRPGVVDVAAFGSESYSKEELVAEMTAAFLCGEAGIAASTLDNSTAYIAGWLRQLANDERLIFAAAAAAQRAADYILARE